jgi:hypothetical protein
VSRVRLRGPGAAMAGSKKRIRRCWLEADILAVCWWAFVKFVRWKRWGRLRSDGLRRVCVDNVLAWWRCMNETDGLLTFA